MAFDTTKKYIIKSISGFYYVKTADSVLECKARGIFRKDGITPATGDYVEIDVSENKPIITNILDRKNLLKRPFIANVDKLFIVLSTTKPAPNFLLADKLITIALFNNIEPVIVMTKNDLASEKEIIEHYENSKVTVLIVEKNKQEAVIQIASMLKGNLSVFTGNSGVGKSTLINLLSEGKLSLETDIISEKLGRGKHTTRAVEIFELHEGLIADTPGFSALDFESANNIEKEDLQYYFPEFAKYLGKCKFNNCAHLKERDCAVKEAMNSAEISRGRYKSYTQIYEEIRGFSNE